MPSSRTKSKPIPAAELRTRYPMHTLEHAKLSAVQLRIDYRAGLIGPDVFKRAKSNLWGRWPSLKPEAWQ